MSNDSPPKTSHIMQVIVGTAGHVDHGKTSLVRLLTGCDTDRLPEEKRRKLSIDLGFAPCKLPGNRIVGIVDVPGHIDFIRNMIAGAASIDVLLLLIAADDGIMPQTVEHLQIVRLLQRAGPRLIVVLSKIDLVDEDIRETVLLETKEFIRTMGFPDAPVIPFSAVSGEGMVELRRTMDRVISGITIENDPRAFRMNVERVFSVKGYGTVVTGIPPSGTAKVGQPVTLHPSGNEHAIRGIEAYKQDMEIAPSHSCAAIILRDLNPDQVSRGMTIAEPGCYRNTDAIMASLKNVTATLQIPRLSECTFLAGTSRIRATVRLPGSEPLPPGKEGFASIKLTEPVVLAAGDRYIIRSLNPPTTLGGGEVLSTAPAARKKLSWNYEELLYRAHLALMEQKYGLAEILAGSFIALSRQELIFLTHQGEAEAEAIIGSLLEEGELLDLGGGAYLVHAKLPAVLDSLVKLLEAYHTKHTHSWGMEHTHMCRFLGLEPRAYPGLIESLTSDPRICYSKNRYHLAGHKPDLNSHDLNQKEKIYSYISKGGIHGQVRGVIMKKFGLNEDKYRFFMRMLTEEEIVRVAGNYVLTTDFHSQVREMLREHFESHEAVTLWDLRKILGCGRHYAVDLLESFDAEKYTRRVKAGRVLAGRKRAPESASPPVESGEDNKEMAESETLEK